MIVLDTSVMIDSFTGTRRSAAALWKAIERSERLTVPSLVFYEWSRGPRSLDELADQESLLPKRAALLFGPEEANIAADIYRVVKRRRGREIDIAIAACAIVRDAELWTLNIADFRDLPGLRVRSPGNV